MERRRIIKSYLFSLVVIFCIFTFFAGAVTVSERTRYNMELTEYERLSVTKEEKGIRLIFGDDEYFIRNETVEKMGKNAFYAAMGDVFTYIGDFFEKNAD